MDYENFSSLEEAKRVFHIQISDQEPLFGHIKSCHVGEFLNTLFKDFGSLTHKVGKNRELSELIIAPILIQVRNIIGYGVCLLSDVEFDVDPSRGLTGECDYLFIRSEESFLITRPILPIAVAEARPQAVHRSFPRCIAQMVAAQLHNRMEGTDVKRVYGCITTGTVWKFLLLENARVMIDRDDYYIDDLGKILAIFVDMIHVSSPDILSKSRIESQLDCQKRQRRINEPINISSI
ncbi:MAG: hypothetical protein B6244_02420 [Candidatus Cloacimonetes bacterium 4572_55]|nr:MAG: hypothetical protein B6244_02420 [Candidatus Cloacimonetes bacterium 4572_55]